ncbi:hypothetical protein EVAR_38519_1 [Eumeta japonica]|uniref:Uncharacterized protein n=1 Tax=Eumeta variegata TaxID=151549 RepID=A0A4C1WEF2_EUMVA|nr:hypothetical protein EVAR_38519_1 [Eumeta japonica]
MRIRNSNNYTSGDRAGIEVFVYYNQHSNRELSALTPLASVLLYPRLRSWPAGRYRSAPWRRLWLRERLSSQLFDCAGIVCLILFNWVASVGNHAKRRTGESTKRAFSSCIIIFVLRLVTALFARAPPPAVIKLVKIPSGVRAFECAATANDLSIDARPPSGYETDARPETNGRALYRHALQWNRVAK